MDSAKQIKDNPFDIKADRPDHYESSRTLQKVVAQVAEREALGIWVFSEADIMAGIELAERN